MNKYQLPIDKTISQLGYASSDNLFMFNQLTSLPLSLHYQKVFKQIHPYAVYILDNSPFVLFFDEMFDNDSSFNEISKIIWNAQIPVVIFCNESQVKIFNGLSIDLNNYTLNQIDSYSLDSCDDNSDFSYWKISDSAFWSNYTETYSKTNLNQNLLNNISYITNELKNTYHIKFATKLVLRLIFIRYLIDRGIDIDYNNFSSDISRSQAEFLEIVRKKEYIYDLFSHLKAKFNGNLFEMGNEIECKELTDDVFTLLSDFFSGKEVLQSKQLSLFSLYNFNIIPVELISNIYEILLGKKIRDKDNAFFTPNFIVEYILDKTVSVKLKKNNAVTVLDPSCGSGAFLVNCFRRIIHQNLDETPYCNNDFLLTKLLTDNIFGIDINEEAIDVTTFSLYLTLMDYKDPKTLSDFTFPNLKGKNLFVCDFFDIKKTKYLSDRISFDFIIGNPPWGNTKTGLHMSYCKSNGYCDMQQNNEISRSFVFRAKDFCTTDTVCCFVLHSKLLYNQKKPAVNFRKYLLSKTQIQRIIELSSVRKLIFENANAPSAIVSFKYNNMDNLNHVFSYTSVKPNIFFKLFNIICIEKNDVKNVPQSLLFSHDWAWKTIVYGNTYDIDIILGLKHKYPTLGETLQQQTPSVIMGAGIEYQDGDKKDASHLLGMKLLSSKKGVEHFYVNTFCTTTFDKPEIHRPRDSRLFEPPYILIPTGINCKDFKLKSAYSEKSFISKKTMYIIKGVESQKDFLINLVGLFNSSLYAYLNLMIGTSAGIEREQRFMNEIFTYPYLFSDEIVEMVKKIQANMIIQNESMSVAYDVENDIYLLDKLILNKFKLLNNNFIDYALHIQIPELTHSDSFDIYRKVTADDLKEYSSPFINHFSAVFNPCQKYISVKIYPNIKNHYAVFELNIKDGNLQSEIVVEKDTNNEKNLLLQFSLYEYNDKFYQFRDVIHFSNDSFYIIKTNIYKNWHPAIAEIDFTNVVNHIMSDSREDN